MKQLTANLLYLLFFFNTSISAQETPFQVDSLFDMSQAESLGLDFAPSAETFTIFSPDSTQNRYNHGVVLYPFKGMLYAQWQSSAVDEDGADTHVYYSRSSDGKNWSRPMSLTNKWEKGITTSGGWWSYNDTLYAFICVWPDSVNPKGGYTEYMCSTDGLHWNYNRKRITNIKGKAIDGIIEQDVHALPSGRIITAFHMQPGLIVSPYYTDDKSGIRSWKKGKIKLLKSKKKEISREIEPSWFYRKDSAIIMIFRDQDGSFKKLASISFDQGKTWTTPTLIDTPDSRAKQSAGNLPDGTAFMVNNPSGNKQRFPLVITLSADGYHFNKAYLLRSGGKDLQPLRYQGKYKRVGYSYPKSVVWGEYLYVGYATNKEDVELTRIPVKEISKIHP